MFPAGDLHLKAELTQPPCKKSVNFTGSTRLMGQVL